MSSELVQQQFAWQGYDAESAADKTLQGFLVLDMQYSSRHADDLRGEIEAYLQDGRRDVSGSGNGYEYECQPDGFCIDCLYEGDPLTPVSVDYATVIKALGEWSDYCKLLEASS